MDGTALDFDGDGQLTLSDLGTAFWQLLFMPGEYVLHQLLTYAPGVARFLELTADDTRAPLVLIVSVFIWLGALLAFVIGVSKIVALDRLLTARVAWCIEEVRRHGRVLRRRLTSWIGYWRSRHGQESSLIESTEVRLPGIETAVLRCHANADDQVPTLPDQIAARLRLRPRQVRDALGRLCELRLIEPTVDPHSGSHGYAITQAGQIYLINL